MYTFSDLVNNRSFNVFKRAVLKVVMSKTKTDMVSTLQSGAGDNLLQEP